MKRWTGRLALAALAGVMCAVGAARADDDATPYVEQWLVVGPFANDGGAGFDKAYGPEQAKSFDRAGSYDGLPGKVQWQAAKAEDGVVNFLNCFETKENVCCYAFTKIKAAKAMRVKLLVGSDDGVKIWLNGEQVHANPADRALTKDEDTVDVKLKEGDNDLLVKVLQGGGDWSLSVKLAKADESVAGLTFAVPAK